MPAAVAKFDADFTDFSREVKRAEADLGKFTVSSKDADRALKEMSGAATDAAPGVNSLQQSYRQFDGVLSAAGINIGPIVKGIEDLGLASGKTAGQLGALGVAGLAIGTFTAAFTATRGVVEKFFPDLDGWIAANVANVMGWGDVTQQTALATADTLTKASEIAGKSITDLNIALGIINKAEEERLKKVEAATKAQKEWKEATEELVAASLNNREVLDPSNGATVEGAKWALAHGASQKSVATAYEMSKAQIAAVVELMKQEKLAAEETAKAEKTMSEFRDAARKRQWEMDKQIAADREAATAIVNAAIVAEMQAQLQLNALYAGPQGAASAVDQYNAALARLRASKVEGVALTQQEALLDKQLADALLAEAQAADQAAAAMRGHNDALTAAVPAAQAASAAVSGARNAMGITGTSMSSVDALGRPVISPFLSGMPINRDLDRQIWADTQAGNWARFAGGPITVNYPIMNDPQALNQLSELMGRALGQSTTKAGRSPV